MIKIKEFYFIRHGQTDQNLREGNNKQDFKGEAYLNHHGIEQARSLQTKIAHLPLVALCHSPSLRAIQTKQIISQDLQIPHYKIPELGECRSAVWAELKASIGKGQQLHLNAKEFLSRVKSGLDKVSVLPGPSLIVSHAGVHLALCYLFNLDSEAFPVPHCKVIHFYLENNAWLAKSVF